MLINELPDLVLVKIFDFICDDRRTTFSSYYKFQRLKTSLELLSVCRVWRQLAAHVVYRTALVRCISDSIHVCGDTMDVASCSTLEGYVDSAIDEELDRQKMEGHIVTSNLDLLTNIKGPPHPTSIEVVINTCENPVYSFRNVVEKIRCHSWLLGRVRKLRINIISVFQANRLFNELQHMAEAISMGEQLSQLIPSVQCIDWKGNSNAPVVIEFVKSVVKSYAQQLSGFVLPRCALEKTQHFSNKLRHVKVHGGLGYAGRLPPIPTDNITTLDLEYIGDNFDWSALVSKRGPKCMSFDRLTSLQLRVDNDDHMPNDGSRAVEYNRHDFEHTISAPKLENLIIRICPFAILFLASIQDVSMVRNVDFEIVSTIFSFRGFDFSLARKTFAKYAQGGGGVDTRTFYQYTLMNEMFNIPGLAEYSKVTVGYSYDTLDIDQVDWTFLSEIEFHNPPRACDLEKWVTKHPNLKVSY